MKKWYAVIGDPISHSMSPFMHTKWLEELGLNASYIPIQVKKEQLAQAISSLKLLGASGWNVTIPHKEAIIQHLDHLDESAKWMGAVNTVVVEKDGSLTGYNTDGTGFVQSLEESIGRDFKQSSILVIGAGGAARGISFALKSHGYKDISCTNRTVDSARKLVNDINGTCAYSLDEAEAQLANFQILIQTTPSGMKDSGIVLPLSLKSLKPSAIVTDIVYNPLLTPFLLEAKEKRVEIITGLGMFVHQGALSFQKWTTHQPNTKRMIAELEQLLGGPNVNR
ncbi:MAG: shikimate dehydrogenase [Paenisporosarcina sp.]